MRWLYKSAMKYPQWLTVSLAVAITLTVAACPPAPPPPPPPPPPDGVLELTTRLEQGDGGMPFLDRAVEVIGSVDNRFVFVASQNHNASIEIFDRTAKSGALTPFQAVTLQVPSPGGGTDPVLETIGVSATFDGNFIVAWDGENGIGIFTFDTTNGAFVQTDAVRLNGVMAATIRANTYDVYAAVVSGESGNGVHLLRIDPATGTFTSATIFPAFGPNYEIRTMEFSPDDGHLYLQATIDSIPIDTRLLFALDDTTGAVSFLGLDSDGPGFGEFDFDAASEFVYFGSTQLYMMVRDASTGLFENYVGCDDCELFTNTRFDPPGFTNAQRLEFDPACQTLLTTFNHVDGYVSDDEKIERLQLIEIDASTGLPTLATSVDTSSGLEARTSDASFSPDGQSVFAVTTRGHMAVFSRTAKTGLVQESLNVYNEGGIDGLDDIRAGAISSDGESLAILTRGNPARGYDLDGAPSDEAIAVYQRTGASADLERKIFEKNYPSNDLNIRTQDTIAARLSPSSNYLITYEPFPTGSNGAASVHRYDSNSGTITTTSSFPTSGFPGTGSLGRIEDVRFSGSNGLVYFIMRSIFDDSDVAVGTLSLDANTGVLNPIAVSQIQVGEPGLDIDVPSEVAMSADSRSLYLFALTPESSPPQVVTVVTVSIDPSTGIATTGATDEIAGATNWRGMTLSTDDRFLYVLVDNQITIADRNPSTGVLSNYRNWQPQPGVDRTLQNATHLLATPNGAYVAVLEQISLDLPIDASDPDIDPGRWITRVFLFERDTNTGALTQVNVLEDTELDGPQMKLTTDQPLWTNAFFEASDTGNGNTVIYVGSGRELIGIEIT